MKKISNPFVARKDYNCFGCSPSNENGLRMEFFEDGDEVVSKWDPREHFQGFENVLHGGIQAMLADEAAAWLVFVKLKTAGVTSNINIRFKKPAYINQGPIIVRALLKEMKKQFAIITVKILDSGGNLCSESEVQYYTYPEEKAKAELRYPGYEKFFPKD